MPQIEIRPVVSADIPDLTHLNHNGQTEYVWQMNRILNDGEVNIQFREVRLPRSVQVDYPCPVGNLTAIWKERSGLLAATLQGQLVGYIGLSDDKLPSTAWVTELAVSPNVRRKGIATALLLAGQNWACQRRLREIQLALQSKNYPAIRLALKLGFEFCGYNDHYYPSQDIALFFTRLLK